MSLFLKTIFFGVLFGTFLNISDATEIAPPNQGRSSPKGTNHLPNIVNKNLEEGDDDENVFQREERKCTKKCIDAKQSECVKNCKACINKCMPAHVAGVVVSKGERQLAMLRGKKADTRGKFFFTDCTAKCPKD